METPDLTTPLYDPDLPVYAAPEDEFKVNELDGLKSADSYVDPSKATVEGRVTGLLSSGNPLLQRAQTVANQKGNQKGLLNSRGTVLAGTTAMMDKALEIATPDAALYGNMALQKQKADQDAALNTQVAGYEFDKTKLSGNIQGALTNQEQTGLAEIQKLTDSAQLQRVELDNQMKEILQAAELDSAERQALEQVSASLGNQLTGNLERILRDTNITDKVSATEALMTLYRTQLNTAAAFLDLSIDWTTTTSTDEDGQGVEDYAGNVTVPTDDTENG